MWCNKKLHYEIFFFFFSCFFNALLLRYGDPCYHHQFLRLQRLKFSPSMFVQILSFHHFFLLLHHLCLIRGIFWQNKSCCWSPKTRQLYYAYWRLHARWSCQSLSWRLHARWSCQSLSWRLHARWSRQSLSWRLYAIWSHQSLSCKMKPSVSKLKTSHKLKPWVSKLTTSHKMKLSVSKLTTSHKMKPLSWWLHLMTCWHLRLDGMKS